MDGKEYVVEFDFLGKDSIRYYNKVPVEKQVFKNLKLFMDNKDPGDDLFDRLTVSTTTKIKYWGSAPVIIVSWGRQQLHQTVQGSYIDILFYFSKLLMSLGGQPSYVYLWWGSNSIFVGGVAPVIIYHNYPLLH